jgi:hypothetical protein
MQVRRLTDRHLAPGEPGMDERWVVDAVLSGLQDANRALGTDYRISVLEYLPSDTPDASAYSLLAQKIAETAYADPSNKDSKPEEEPS